MKKLRPSKKVLLAAAMVLAVVIVVLVWDWNWFLDEVEQAATERLGRTVSIGHFDVDLFWPPRLIADDVTIADAPWADEEPMAAATRLAVSIRPLSLFADRPRLPDLLVREARVDLRRNDQGMLNWPTDDQEEDDDELPVDLGTVTIEDSTLTYVDPRDGTDLQLQFDSTSDGALAIEGDGQWTAEAFELTATVGKVADIAVGRGFPIDGRLAVVESVLEIDGHAQDGTDFERLALDTRVSGPDPAYWGDLTGWPIPSLPPYEVSGKLERDGPLWRISEASGTVGDSDLSGSATIDTGRDPNHLALELVSGHLDFDDLAGLTGGPPSTEPGETASAEQRAQAEAMEAEDRLLPNRPLNFDRFSAFDADVSYRADSVTASLPIDRFMLEAVMEAGVLRVEPFEIGLAGGQLDGAAALDGTLEYPSVRIDFTARSLNLHALFSGAGETLDQAVGSLHGQGYIQGSGETTAEVLGVAEGAVTASAGGGRLDAMIVELAGLDLGESLVTRLHPGDEAVTVHCALAEAELDAGVADVNGAVSTDDTQFLAAGTIDLQRERLDLVVNGEARDFSIFTFNAPLRIRGPLADPSVAVDKSAVLRGVAAAILGAVTPPAAVLALIEDGDASTAGCRSLVEQLEAGASVTEAAED